MRTRPGLETAGSQPLDYEARDVLVRQKAHFGGENGLMLHVVGRKSQRRPQVVVGQFWVADP
jgi:hypothetical protein